MFFISWVTMNNIITVLKIIKNLFFQRSDIGQSRYLYNSGVKNFLNYYYQLLFNDNVIYLFHTMLLLIIGFRILTDFKFSLEICVCV